MIVERSFRWWRVTKSTDRTKSSSIVLAALVATLAGASGGPARADDYPRIIFETFRTGDPGQCQLDVYVTNKTPRLIESMTATVEVVSLFGGAALRTLSVRMIEPGKRRSDKIYAEGDCSDLSEPAKALWAQGKWDKARGAWLRIMAIDWCIIDGTNHPNCDAVLNGTWPAAGASGRGVLPSRPEPAHR